MDQASLFRHKHIEIYLIILDRKFMVHKAIVICNINNLDDYNGDL